MSKLKISLALIGILLISGCATYKSKMLPSSDVSNMAPASKKVMSVYLMGDAGFASQGIDKYSILAFKNTITKEAKSEDLVLYLGDNIYPKGLPDKENAKRKAAEAFIDAQVDAVKDFKGTTYFIPGNHDWYSQGPKGLKRQEKYVEDALKNNEAFQPENGCAIQTKTINDEVELIMIDTQWYLANWDRFPTINDDCEIKTRNGFFLELENELKKNNNKTIIVATHHPALSYGPHGGYYGIHRHLYPTGNILMPILGSFAAQIRTQGGVTAQDRYNVRYNELMNRIITMVTSSDRAVLVSGHEHTLQYIEDQGVKQIVSGAGSKQNAAKLGPGAKYVSGQRGFAVLDIYQDKSSRVRFYTMDSVTATQEFTAQVHAAEVHYDTSELSNDFNKTALVRAYESGTNTTDGYNWFWGDHYRYVYGTDVKVPVITLDSFKGGFTIDRKGGGHQTRSLRLLDAMGRNFALRAVKKSAVQFLQTVAFKENYIEDDFRETLTEDVILDFYTSSHPYGAFIIPTLSNAIDLYHTNPQLVYMPRHNALGDYNAEFGDELYIIEERPDNGFLDIESFGTPDAIESTSDVIENIRKDEKYQVDEAAFIKARLFDMLIGDWDRHQDQWRWSRFDYSEDKKVYKPIPRDRDQVFSNYDGALFDVLKVIMPVTKQFQEFDGELKDIKWINVAGIKLDRAFTQNSPKAVWLEQASFIQTQLTDQIIDEAFKMLPPEVQDETSKGIAKKLKARREQLGRIASEYYDYLAKLVIITGTDKDDYIEIIRGDNQTKIKVSRIIDGSPIAPFKERIIYADETKEIWVYGLDDDDEIVVNGKGSNPVFTRIIGGQNNDVYTIENGRRIKVYDHKSKPNTVLKNKGATLRFNDIYTNNVYDINKYINRVNMIVPAIGFNPDDGFKIGVSDTYTVKGFKNEPFHRQHKVAAGYFFATQGIDVQYTGEFANTFGNWNVTAAARFTNESFTQNFFGLGNETQNFDDDLGLDFNRVRTGILSGAIGVVRRGHLGSLFRGSVEFTQIEVEENLDRFITQVIPDMPKAFTGNYSFGTAKIGYTYKAADIMASPTRGMFFNVTTGVTTNLKQSERTFGFIKSSLEFYNAITRDRKLVLRTQVQGQHNIGDNFEFFQAANLGANNGLRGYRRERFTGQSALALSADLRLQLLKFKTGLLPLKLGVYTGYDYGRVWIAGEDSNTWHDSYGGGLLLNAVDAVSGQFGLFSSDDGLRVSFGFGFQF